MDKRSLKVIKKDLKVFLIGIAIATAAVVIPVAGLSSGLPEHKETKTTTRQEYTTQTTQTTQGTTEVTAVVYPSYDVPLTEDLLVHIFKECEKHDVDPAIIIAMIERESNFKADAIGDDGESFGLMQIKVKYQYKRMLDLGCTNLLDPYHNVTVGIEILAERIQQGNGIEWALMAYNGGSAYADEMVKHSKVSNYAIEVINRAERLGIEK